MQDKYCGYCSCRIPWRKLRCPSCGAVSKEEPREEVTERTKKKTLSEREVHKLFLLALKGAPTALREAAEQGHAEAQYVLGKAIENGEGFDGEVENLLYVAEIWYKKAAEQGHPKAIEAYNRMTDGRSQPEPQKKSFLSRLFGG